MKYVFLFLLLSNCVSIKSMDHQPSNQGTILEAVGLMRCMCVEWAMAVITDDSIKYRIDYTNIRKARPTSDRCFLSMAHDTLYYDGEAHLIKSIKKIKRRHVYADFDK